MHKHTGAQRQVGYSFVSILDSWYEESKKTWLACSSHSSLVTNSYYLIPWYWSKIQPNHQYIFSVNIQMKHIMSLMEKLNLILIPTITIRRFLKHNYLWYILSRRWIKLLLANILNTIRKTRKQTHCRKVAKLYRKHYLVSTEII